MKTIMIDLKQFPTNYKECDWLRSLISFAKEYFSKVEIFAERLWINADVNYSHKLDIINEASSVDFTYNIVNGSIKEIKSLLKKA